VSVCGGETEVARVVRRDRGLPARVCVWRRDRGLLACVVEERQRLCVGGETRGLLACVCGGETDVSVCGGETEVVCWRRDSGLLACVCEERQTCLCVEERQRVARVVCVWRRDRGCGWRRDKRFARVCGGETDVSVCGGETEQVLKQTERGGVLCVHSLTKTNFGRFFINVFTGSSGVCGGRL
jgi:hypothetical protein